MRDDTLADWLGGEGDEPGGASRHEDEAPEPRWGRRRLWAAAAVVWALIGGLAVTLAVSDDDERVAGAGDADTDAAGTEAADTDPDGPDPAGGDPIGSDVEAAADAGARAAGARADGGPGPGRDGTGDPGADTGALAGPTDPLPGPTAGGWTRADAEAAAVAATAVRLSVTATTPPGGGVRYVDLATPAAVERHGDLAVVTLDVVVLDGSEDGWGPPRARRFAQAVAQGPEGSRALGAPWRLPDPPAAAEADTTPLDAPPELVADLTAGLDTAGYDVADVTSVHRIEAAPDAFLVRALLSSDGGDRAAQRELWMSARPPHRVLGAAVDTTTPEGS